MIRLEKILSLLLALCLLPVMALAESPELEYEDDPVVEDVSLDDEEDFDEDHDDEKNEFVISDEIYEELNEMDQEIDDSIDRKVLELNKNLPDNVINILLVGIDTRSTDLEKGEQHGDVQIILSIDKATGSIKLTSIQRDLLVTLPGYKNKQRINVAYHFGQSNPNRNGSGGEFAMRTINHNFQMNIEYYATINFYGLASVVDYLGGIDMELTKAEATHINSYLRQHPPAYDNHKGDPDYVRQELERVDGVQHLDGVQAVMYARTRKVDNDFNRTDRQRKLLEVLLQKVMSENMSVDRLMELMDIATDYVNTNMNLMDMLTLAVGLLNSGIIDKAQNGETLMEQFRMPMDDTWKYSTVNGSSVVEFKSKGLQKNTEALHEFIYGEYIPAKSK